MQGESCSFNKSNVHDSADIARICPSRSITQLAWRCRGRRSAASLVTPGDVDEKYSQPTFELAVASEDTSARVYSISELEVEI